MMFRFVDMNSRYALDPIDERLEMMSTSSSTSNDETSREDAPKPAGYYRKFPNSPSISTEASESDTSFDSSSIWKVNSSVSSSVNDSCVTSSSPRDPKDKTILRGAHLSNEHVRLSELLSTMHPDDLKSELLKRVDKKDSRTIVALSILFPRSQYATVDNAHCVRCHNKYRTGADTLCVLRHPNSAVSVTRRDGNGSDFHCRVCSRGFRLNNMYFYDEKVNSYLSGWCFSGPHTTNPQLVDYTSGSTHTCEDYGCVEFYV